MKVYFSGKINGLELREAKNNFALAIAEFEFLFRGSVSRSINPFNIKPLLGIEKYWCYMIADIFQLLKCDTIYMLNNWKDSRGAKIELAIAILTRKKILFQL